MTKTIDNLGIRAVVNWFTAIGRMRCARLWMAGLLASGCSRQAPPADHASSALEEPPLVPSRTALILIELQNEWLQPGLPLYGLIDRNVRRYRMVERTAELRNTLAKQGVLVVHAPLVFQEGYPEIPNPRGLQRGIVEQGLFLAGSDGAAFHPEFEPRANEPVIRGRSALSSFSGSDLSDILEGRGIDTVILAGFATSVCVTNTAVDAFDRGYRVILPSEAVATFDEGTILSVNLLKRMGEEIFHGALGEVLTNDQILERIR